MVLALLDGAGVGLHESGVPAKNRWGSMSTANAEFLLAEMCHSVCHRLFAEAFPLQDIYFVMLFSLGVKCIGNSLGLACRQHISCSIAFAWYRARCSVPGCSTICCISRMLLIMII